MSKPRLFFLSKERIILGIDPGTTVMGYGLIKVEGNKRTRTANVLRELNFSVGDTLLISNYLEVFNRNELLLKSTGLFSTVSITNTLNEQASSTVNVKVEEALFIYPLLNISFADRNFNVWWVEQNHKLNRLNYTLQLSHRNLTGRRDLLTTYVQLGYEPKFQLTYIIRGVY